MKTTELFAAQVEREAAISRRTLARVPPGRDDWKPHEKSMALHYLATLVATMPSWIERMVVRDELDLNPASGGGFRPPQWTTTEELLAIHDGAVASAVAALRKTDDARLDGTWRLQVAGRVVDENPRHVFIADTLAHLAHHRGQLTVYLRLMDVPVPSIYGPSADDKTF
jgi:uncharacterized damage-inducible protein DinB